MLALTKVLFEQPSSDISGAQATGIALKKGAQATGDALGSVAKGAADLAGNHPVMGGMVVGALGAAGALGLRKLKRQQ